MISLSKPLRAIRRRSLRAVNSPPAGGFRTQSGPGCRSRTGSPRVVARVVPRRRRGHSRTWSARRNIIRGGTGDCVRHIECRVR
jgi:hypothetical protein